MTAKEEPDGHQPSTEDPAGRSLTAGVSTLDVHDEKRESDPPKTIDFVTMAMFIIGKPYRHVHRQEAAKRLT